MTTFLKSISLVIFFVFSVHANELTHSLNIVLGDRWYDGHGLYESYQIRSNLSPAEINEAYQRGVEQIGFDLTNDVASDYSNSTLTKEHYNLLLENGIVVMLESIKYEERKISLSPSEFFNIWLGFVQKGNAEFEYNLGQSAEINIGGYGLFE